MNVQFGRTIARFSFLCLSSLSAVAWAAPVSTAEVFAKARDLGVQSACSVELDFDRWDFGPLHFVVRFAPGHGRRYVSFLSHLDSPQAPSSDCQSPAEGVYTCRSVDESQPDFDLLPWLVVTSDSQLTLKWNDSGYSFEATRLVKRTKRFGGGTPWKTEERASCKG